MSHEEGVKLFQELADIINADLIKILTAKIERLERDNAALLAACKEIREKAKLRDSTAGTAQDQLYAIFQTAKSAITQAEAP